MILRNRVNTKYLHMELQDFIDFRHEVHQHPELSGEEYETKKRVARFIQMFNPDEIIEVGKTGLLFAFKGELPGKSIMIRAELDALPIQEINELPYKSIIENISHKCGHDGHLTILARLAFLLSQQKLIKGTAYLLFQPSEENGMGAKEVFASEKFREIHIDRVVALHNIPGYPIKSIILRNGSFTPAVRSIIVKFTGKTSHAAEPENGYNPGWAMADFLKEALTISNNNIHQDEFFLVTPVYTCMGEKSYGVSAGYGEVHLTVRSWRNNLLLEKSRILESLARKIGEENHLEIEIEWLQEFKANENKDEVVNDIRKAAKSLGLQIIERETPMKWGEDFGLFTELYEGAMFGLGSGENQAALHNPDFDFPDELIETGSLIFEKIVREYLNS